MSRYISLVLTSIVFALNYIDQPMSTCNILVRFNCAAIMLIQAICEHLVTNFITRPTPTSPFGSPIAALAVLTQRAYYVSLRSRIVACGLTLFILALVALGITHAVVAVETSPEELIHGHGVCRV